MDGKFLSVAENFSLCCIKRPTSAKNEIEQTHRHLKIKPKRSVSIMPANSPNQPKENKENKTWRDSKFARRLRAVRVNRAVFLSAIIILSALAVILVITAVTNRARRRAAEEVLKPLPADELTEPAPQSDEPSANPSPSVDPAPADVEPSVPTVETVPVLSLPVDGALLQVHSSDLQVFSRTMQDYRVHLGVDLVTAADAPVLAAADGTVARIWDDPMMGKCVALSHAADTLTVYKNLSPDLPEDVTVGSSVVRGQRIGTVGDTALLEVAEEPHLHLEMTVGGLQVDPLDYFPSSVVTSLSRDTSFEDVDGEK